MFQVSIGKRFRQCCLLRILYLKCLEEYNIAKQTNIIYRLLFADDQVILKQDKDKKNIWQKLIVEFHRSGLNVNIRKTLYLNVGSDLQNITFEHNIEIKGSRSFKYLGFILLTPENSTKC